MIGAMDGVLRVNEDSDHQRSGSMDGFHPELAELLSDPITHRVMESDQVSMPTLLALLQSARRRLRDAPERARREPCHETAFRL
jgi:hypothetical protein